MLSSRKIRTLYLYFSFTWRWKQTDQRHVERHHAAWHTFSMLASNRAAVQMSTIWYTVCAVCPLTVVQSFLFYLPVQGEDRCLQCWCTAPPLRWTSGSLELYGDSATETSYSTHIVKTGFWRYNLQFKQRASFTSITAQGTPWHPHIINNAVLAFWSSSSCSLSSLSRSSMSLCLKYLMKLRDAWRPFWMEKQAASSLNTQSWTQHRSKKAARDRSLFLCAEPQSDDSHCACVEVSSLNSGKTLLLTHEQTILTQRWCPPSWSRQGLH